MNSDANSDSDGSYISATPPREEEEPKVKPIKASLLAFQASYKPRIRRVSSWKHDVSAPNSIENLPVNFCSKSIFFSKLKRSYSIPEEEPAEKFFAVQSEAVPEPEIGGIHHDAESTRNCVGSVDTENKAVSNGEPVKFVSKHTNLIGGDVNLLPSTLPKAEWNAGNCMDSVTSENSSKVVSNGEPMNSVRKHGNLLGGNVSLLPSRTPKATNEGNFVRLNINGYGRSKFKNKTRRKYGSSSSNSRRSQWRRNKRYKAEGENEADGLCDEDGLVTEKPKLQKQKENLKVSQELVEEVVLDARKEPSDENLRKLLKLSHGYDSFRDGQLEAIKQVISGKSTMLVLPTGAGKSLCYQLSTLILPGITLVVSPLVALMVDQLRQLPPMIQGGLLSSSQTFEEASETVRQLLEGNIKVLFVSPERFLSSDFLSKVGAAPPISLVVVDEAHCLSEWSHNFRPSYLRLRASLLRTTLNVPCILAMTATATTKTLWAVMSALDIPQTNLVLKSQIRENLKLSVTLSGDRKKDLMALMKSSPFKDIQSIIVYCKFQYETDIICKYLCDNNISAKSYHSSIPAKDRNRTQELFCSNKIKVVVATVAFGMGLDKSDVGAVIHYSLPESLEEYVQEIGRAGRDNRMSFCHLFYDDSTYFKLRSLLYSEGVDEYAINKFLCQVFRNDMNSIGKICSLVKASASQKYDMKEEVMLTVLTQLELMEVQYLRLLPQLHVTCSLYFHKTTPALLAATNIVVAEIIKKSETKQGPYVFDLPTVANSIRITANDLSNHLQNLKLKGEITYEVKDPAFCYTIVKSPEDFCSLTSHITRWLSEVEICKVRKLDEMYKAATFASRFCQKTNGCSGSLHTQCLQSRISDYFGRDGSDFDSDVPNAMGKSSPFLRADIKVFLQSNSHVKFTPRAIARIMHGIPSPAFPSAIWSKTHFWGRYLQIDFPIVMEAATVELVSFAGKAAL
ncbi:Atp-dependent dna helicase [Thalictrum thalictroides]|uniref:DNA 3'-5' helicase n=1 Tax=Thalictrum thalictroides TaxID=46969 RepID=A0A7J6VZS5_THATH|nr:Atp-dependent dna helicase [Thalictrum thalictroides]